jgi:hypothetical protein
MTVHADNGDRTAFYNLDILLPGFKVSHLIFKKNCLSVHRCETPYHSYVCHTHLTQKPAEYFEVHRDTPLIIICTIIVLFPYRCHCFNYWTYWALLNNRKIVIGSGSWTDWTCLSEFKATEFSTRGADKSLAQTWREQATATKLGIYWTYSPRSSTILRPLL